MECAPAFQLLSILKIRNLQSYILHVGIELESIKGHCNKYRRLFYAAIINLFAEYGVQKV